MFSRSELSLVEDLESSRDTIMVNRRSYIGIETQWISFASRELEYISYETSVLYISGLIGS